MKLLKKIIYQFLPKSFVNLGVYKIILYKNINFIKNSTFIKFMFIGLIFNFASYIIAKTCEYFNLDIILINIITFIFLAPFSYILQIRFTYNTYHNNNKFYKYIIMITTNYFISFLISDTINKLTQLKYSSSVIFTSALMFFINYSTTTFVLRNKVK
jgi:hypothetical protein